MRNRAIALLVVVVLGVGAFVLLTKETPTTDESGCKTSSSTDTSKQPEIKPPGGAPPSGLQTCDLVTGTGAPAKVGDKVFMHYRGVFWDTGAGFDASWDRGQTIGFTLGIDRVIQGWHQGIVGMKLGGRRELIIPPDLAYGAAGRPGIPPNATLVFVVDLVRNEPGPAS